MKKLLTTLLCAMLTLGAFAQEKLHTLTQFQRDSVLVNIMFSSRNIAKDTENIILSMGSILNNTERGRFKVYRTENIYNSLKLDTATGRVTALQIGINNDSSRFEYSVCDAIYDYDWKNIGRFELYPTGNRYNFILIDTMFGSAWQVQWSTDNNCGRWRIW